jgi:hypothetical protein
MKNIASNSESGLARSVLKLPLRSAPISTTGGQIEHVKAAKDDGVDDEIVDPSQIEPMSDFENTGNSSDTSGIQSPLDQAETSYSDAGDDEDTLHHITP